MTTVLVKYDAARRALAEAHRVDEAKDIRDKAVAVQAYAKQANDHTLIVQATDIKLRAERRVGELLHEMAERGERAGQGQGNGKGRTPQPLPTLDVLGVSKTQSSRWQDLAAMPAQEFEDYAERETERQRGIVTGVARDAYAERGHDLYETPAPATHALLNEEKFTGTIWEPAAGRGALSRVLRARGYRVVCTDLISYDGADEDVKGGVDFLKQEHVPKGVKAIVTNPPFMLAEEFVRHALALVPRVAMLSRLGFLCSISRADILDGGKLARVYPFANTVSFNRDGEGVRGHAIEFAWFVWDREHRGRATLKRILCEGE
jgi:hypothetical protein